MRKQLFGGELCAVLTANLSRISCELALCARMSSTLRFKSGASALVIGKTSVTATVARCDREGLTL